MKHNIPKHSQHTKVNAFLCRTHTTITEYIDTIPNPDYATILHNMQDSNSTRTHISIGSHIASIMHMYRHLLMQYSLRVLLKIQGVVRIHRHPLILTMLVYACIIGTISFTHTILLPPSVLSIVEDIIGINNVLFALDPVYEFEAILANY